MKKIKLDLDGLRVDSFPTVAGDDGRGTVVGLETAIRCSGGVTCLGDPTCLGWVTCGCACSETDGVAVCKSCGPSCYE